MILLDLSDYTSVLEDYTFVSGTRTGSRLCFEISIADDGIVEYDERFSINLQPVNESLVRITFPSIAEVIIIDDDGKQ